MSIETHQRAMRVFKQLEAMEHPQDALRDESHEAYGVPCSAGLTAVIFGRLGIDVDEWDIYWAKLYKRPVARVFNFYLAAKDVKPEQYAHLISSFGKKVKPLGVAA